MMSYAAENSSSCGGHRVLQAGFDDGVNGGFDGLAVEAGGAFAPGNLPVARLGAGVGMEGDVGPDALTAQLLHAALDFGDRFRRRC